MRGRANSAWLHRVIHNAVELRQFIAEAFPEAVVELVEWHHLPFAQQLQKLGHTSVLITPCGGVSMILPFLPDGAHAIVMDYLSTGSRDDPWGSGGCPGIPYGSTHHRTPTPSSIPGLTPGRIRTPTPCLVGVVFFVSKMCNLLFPPPFSTGTTQTQPQPQPQSNPQTLTNLDPKPHLYPSLGPTSKL
eukprot:EG_transcript_11685